MKVSVVIIARNEAHIIGNTLQSLQGLTNDIIVADSGSSDGTREICKQYGAKVLPVIWAGYGHAKNEANAAAANNWILSLDADEAIDETLKNDILELKEVNEHIVYELKFKNFLCRKHIRFGEWGNDTHIRLFNKNRVSWNDAGVHEGLVLDKHAVIKQLPGYVLHYTADNLKEYEKKTVDYARMNAGRYFEQGKKVNPFKKYFSSCFSFLHNYILKLGFLDGKAGFWIARNTARYTWLKYACLEQLYKNTG